MDVKHDVFGGIHLISNALAVEIVEHADDCVTA